MRKLFTDVLLHVFICSRAIDHESAQRKKQRLSHAFLYNLLFTAVNTEGKHTSNSSSETAELRLNSSSQVREILDRVDVQIVQKSGSQLITLPFNMLPWRHNARLMRLFLRCPYSTTAASSPPITPSLLVKVRGDMKAAMKAKDTPRYVVNAAYLYDLSGRHHSCAK